MSKELGGYMGKVLKLDLSTQQASEYPWTDEDCTKWLGGKIMAAKILYDNITERIDPYSAENMLVVSTGPLTGTGAPSSSRFNVSGLSPLTGLLASSNCGGSFGLHLKKAGYDALVITGTAEKLMWVEITEDEVQFHDADHLRGKTTGETQEVLGGKTGKLVIGPAGEHRVRFAGIFSQERTAGRAGLGAVMGSKNLKAVVAGGTKKVEVHSRARMKKVYKGWIKLLAGHPLTGEALPKYGSGFLLREMQRSHVLVTHNFKQGQYADHDKLSGQTLAATRLTKNWGCPSCTVKCSRQVEIDGRPVKGPELETLALLGPNLENSDLDTIIRWNFQLDELGMDTISTGGVIGFAMELNERGLWDNGLRFGKTDNIAQVFDDIAFRRGIGDDLADGTKRLAEKYGGEDFAIHAKGLELAAYEPRGAVGQGLGYATANRGGCHLNAGYTVLMEGLGLRADPYTKRGKAPMTIMNQNLMEGISAAGNCLFPLFSFYPAWPISHPDSIITRIVNWTLPFSGGVVNLMNKLPGKWLPFHMPALPHTKALAAVTGIKYNVGMLKETGERGFVLERLFNIRFGVTAADDRLPKRLTDEPQIPDLPKSRVPLDEMKPEFYRIRGWDANGVPTDEKLKQLGLA